MLRLASAIWLALAVIAGPALAAGAMHGAGGCPMMADARMEGHAHHDPAPKKAVLALACCVAVCGAFLAAEGSAPAQAPSAAATVPPAAPMLAGHPGEPDVPPPKPLFPMPA